MGSGSIYKITSPSGRVYIGQTISLERRISEYKRCHCKSQPIIYKSLIKYGFDAHLFEVLETLDVHLLNERERYWQDFYSKSEKGIMNLCLTKTSDRSGKVDDFVKEKISKSKTGKKRLPFSEKWKLNLSLAHTGRKMPIKSPETIKKMSEAQKGKKSSKESIEKRCLKSYKPIFQYTKEGLLINNFKSIKDAADHINGNSSNISLASSGKLLTYKGYVWRRDIINDIGKVYHPGNRKVVNTKTNEIFPSIKSACVASGIKYSTFYNLLTKPNKSNNTGFILK